MEVKGPNQTRETKTKVSETAGIKTKVTRTIKTATKETPALGVTKVVVEGATGKTRGGKYNPPQGDNNASASSVDQQGIYDDDDIDSSD